MSGEQLDPLVGFRARDGILVRLDWLGNRTYGGQLTIGVNHADLTRAQLRALGEALVDLAKPEAPPTTWGAQVRATVHGVRTHLTLVPADVAIDAVDRIPWQSIAQVEGCNCSGMNGGGIWHRAEALDDVEVLHPGIEVPE